MNESTVRKSTVATTVKDTEMRVFIGVPGVVLCAALLLANLPAIAFAQPSCNGIHVKILDVRNSTGTVACALFESSDGFPAEYLRVVNNL
jgi:uncharacterized protein (DUF2141 family)